MSPTQHRSLFKFYLLLPLDMSKKRKINSDFKIGILGGGQLGKMLCLAAQPWDVTTCILDVDPSFPAGNVCDEFTQGNFKKYDDVYNFGKDKEVITIEIEHVNTDALKQLVKEGKTVHPNPHKLEIIQDKYLQKKYFHEHGLPVSSYDHYDSASDIKEAFTNGKLELPFVQKTRTAGYDGRGVAIIKNEDDLNNKLLEAPSLIEPLVNIKKELAVIVAKNESGDIKAFPPVEMDFNPDVNLVEWVISPALITERLQAEAVDIAIKTIQSLDICGLLAVELFLTQENQILINEVAPRPHNSGHHTIDAAFTSQYQQHLRAILNWPLGNTKNHTPSLMVNLLGAPNQTGKAIYKNVDKCLALDGVKMHLYGKEITKPFRKMGHMTIVDSDLENAKNKARFIKEHLTIISDNESSS